METVFMEWQTLIETVIAGFPVFGAMAVAWLMAEKRCQEANRRYERAERRTRIILMESAGLQPSELLNGDS